MDHFQSSYISLAFTAFLRHHYFSSNSSFFYIDFFTLAFFFGPKLSYSRFHCMILRFKYMKLKAALNIKMLFLCVSLFLPLSTYCSIYPVYTFIFIAVRFSTSGFWSHIILYMEVKAHFESFLLHLIVWFFHLVQVQYETKYQRTD